MMEESLGKRLQRLRKNAKLTQEEVAERLNLTPQAVSKWENDGSAPDISLLVEIAELFRVTVDELLGKQPQTVFSPQRKAFDSLLLKIKVLSDDGDKVHVNLPLALVKALMQSGVALPVGNNDALKNIDFQQIVALCEQGLLGKIVDVESADGDLVEIWVE